jgi:hypothetical protein
MGHNSTLVGWPWVDGTHSWLEPTAWCVLALSACGDRHHPRTREGVQLIADRLLASGGCNYGNTIVLGQELRPHVEPTGLALLALAGQPDRHGRIAAAKRWVSGEIGPKTPVVSLSYALLGLSAHRSSPHEADDWLQGAFDRLPEPKHAGLKLALLALASAASNPLTHNQHVKP